MHQKWQDMIAFYVAGALLAEDVVALEKHLNGCDACRKSVEEWRMIGEGVRAEAEIWSTQLPPLSPAVRASLYAARPQSNGDYRQRAQIARSNSTWVGQRSWSMMSLAAAVLVVIFGGMAVYFMNHNRLLQDQAESATSVAMLSPDGATEEAADTTVPTATMEPAVLASPTATHIDFGIILTESATTPPTPSIEPSTTIAPSQGAPNPSPNAPIGSGGGNGSIESLIPAPIYPVGDVCIARNESQQPLSIVGLTT
jgi:hypothetical protein